LRDHFGVSTAATLNALAGALLQPLPPTIEVPTPLVALDPYQTAVAEVEHGPVLIDAGPGTGKTRALVGRICHLLHQGVPPEQILAVTFSNRAAGDMRERLALAVPEHAPRVTVCTFHGFCLDLLRRFHDAAALPPDFVIADEADLTVLLERNLVALGLDRYQHLGNPGFYLKALVQAVSQAKDELASPARYAALATAAATAAIDDKERDRAAKLAEVANVYAVYERLLENHGLIDFGGLVMRSVLLLRERPDILDQIRREYRQILVDEYQDMNRASAVLLQLLAGDGRGLWVVGDVRQAIYRFRGASPANVSRFADDFPGGRILSLGVNYRSDPNLVSLFGTVAAAVGGDSANSPVWEAARAQMAAPRVWLAEADDEWAEAAGIAEEVARRHQEGQRFKDQAVLVRTHRQARPIVAALEQAEIPVLYLGDLFARAEVRDMLALLSLVVEGGGVGLIRVGAMTEYWMPRHDRHRLIAFAKDKGLRTIEALALASEAELGPASVEAAVHLRADLESVGWQTSPWQFFARYLFGDGALVRRLAQEQSVFADQKLMALGQLLGVARAFAERPLGSEGDATKVLRAFLNHVRRLVANDQSVTSTPAGGTDLDAVRVLTVHAAKGLEFPVVYVTNLAKDRFPFMDLAEAAPAPPGLISDQNEAQDDEERCLFFVAISRAQHEFVLTRAVRYGKTTRPASEFLAYMDPFFEAIGAPVRLHWPSAEGMPVPEQPEQVVPVVLDRSLDIGEVELYQLCPRRYEYRYLLQLSEQEELLGYQRFRTCVSRVTAWVRAEHRAGNELDIDAAHQRLTEEWDRHGPRDHAYEEVYRELGKVVIGRLISRIAVQSPDQAWRDEIEVELGGATIRVRIDVSQVDVDGTVRIVRFRAGRERNNDHKAPRLALLRVAVGQMVGGREKVVIELDYPTVGITKVVKDNKRWEDPRIADLDEAVTGILAGEYPAEPRSPRDCLTCPFWMICPA
jgi:DNA helicase II / ATP-dependent DNA helicase PcrA